MRHNVSQRGTGESQSKGTAGTRTVKGFPTVNVGITSILSKAGVDLGRSLKGNLVPRALFPGFGGAPKAREKRPEDEVA